MQARPDIRQPLIAVLAVLTQTLSICYGAGFPEKPIRWIIGYPPGGASDLLVRVLAQQLTDQVGQQVVVDNRPGATGILAAELAAQAPADGYTLFLGDISTHAINEALYHRLPYNRSDFSPVTATGAVPNMVVVAPAVKAATISDLIALARAQPGRLNYASGGNGTGTHLATELFDQMAHVRLTHVPYKGTPPALLDLMAGRVDVMFAGLPPALAFIKSGKLRPIATTSAKRLSLFPNVPCVADTLPGYDATTWYGVFVPKGTPHGVVMRLNREIRAAIAVPGVRDRLTALGFDMYASTPDEFGAFIGHEAEKYKRLVKDVGIKLE
jgi:tripartite-type tricarboxylate transporter receptor subunit TctC